MEQANQQITQKPALPIKTKIAAWWMIILGILLALLGIGYFIFCITHGMMYDPKVGALGFIIIVSFLVVLPIFICSIFYLSGFYLLKGKKKAWWVTLIFILISVVLSIISLIYLISIYLDPIFYYLQSRSLTDILFTGFISSLLLPPLLLLILDRKNFWKIAT